MEFNQDITKSPPSEARSPEIDQNGGFSRPRSALRMTYESEARRIENRLGNLEEIRQSLGLSRRKICQLLLVDPSAWTRWTQPGAGGGAPPHIYQALDWYLKTQEKAHALEPQSVQVIQNQIGQLERELRLWKALLLLSLTISLLALAAWALGR